MHGTPMDKIAVQNTARHLSRAMAWRQWKRKHQLSLCSRQMQSERRDATNRDFLMTVMTWFVSPASHDQSTIYGSAIRFKFLTIRTYKRTYKYHNRQSTIHNPQTTVLNTKLSIPSISPPSNCHFLMSIPYHTSRFLHHYFPIPYNI